MSLKYKKSTAAAFSIIFLLNILFFSSQCLATKLMLPNSDDDLVGELTSTQLVKDKTIQQLAQENDVGYFELLEANPNLDPEKPLVGTQIIIPSQHVLPHLPRKGIVINLSTMRLFYFPPEKNYLYTYPIGIGKKDWNSPVGKLKIIEKIVDPVWHVPKSIYNYRLKNGDPVPHIMPAGKDNPLGAFAMRLSLPTYLIHGTNEPASVGIRSSAGCIHLYPDDIKELFSLVTIGTPVVIISQPYTAGLHQQEMFIEAHLPLEEDRLALNHMMVDTELLANSVGKSVRDINNINALGILHFHTGIPTLVPLNK